ncbi:hypothetical protein NKJ09_27585 [Mesorhizobium sp. M0189]|uniref:hypothetical protein n=1 Tax=unclassified Mesorhizobium TaxID=325217 RepID=UPI0033369953
MRMRSAANLAVNEPFVPVHQLSSVQIATTSASPSKHELKDHGRHGLHLESGAGRGRSCAGPAAKSSFIAKAKTKPHMHLDADGERPPQDQALKSIKLRPSILREAKQPGV